MSQPQVGDVREARGKVAEDAGVGEAAHGDDLLVRRSSRPDEVGLVRVRETVRAAARRSDNGVLVERQDGVARAGFGEHVRDRVRALRVGDRVPPPVEHGERREGGEELRALE
jgi:hypothetical protein